MEANEPEESAVNKPVFRSRKKEARHLFRQKCKDYWNEWLSFSTMHGSYIALYLFFFVSFVIYYYYY